MIKTKWFSFLVFNTFDKFGDQIVDQFVLFECKYLFSIIFFWFRKSGGTQDRFHTHAFNALSVKFWGSYDEHILSEINEDSYRYNVIPRNSIFRWFPKDCFHRIANSRGCLTMLLSGPWDKTWTEYVNGDLIDYTWGRN